MNHLSLLWKKGTLWLIGVFVILGIAWSAVVLAVEYPSPIPDLTFTELISRVLRYLLTIAIPLAALAIIIVGVRFVLAAASGNTAKVQQAKGILLWVVIGTAAAVGALVIADAVVKYITAL